jgi:glycosyltransferase involved in cell wall biosynthesis
MIKTITHLSSVLGPRSSTVGPRSSVVQPPSPVPGPQPSALSPRSSVLSHQSSIIGPPSSVLRPPIPKVSLLTASRDRPYALGLAAALIAEGISFDFIGGDGVDSPELHGNPQVNYLNLRNQRTDAGLLQKMTRVLLYYFRLISYAVTARPGIFHILWNNKFEFLDRTVLMAFYKLLGKKIVFTVHNVNAGIRDGNDSWLNRLSLKIQYRLSDHIFVHTEKMKAELAAQFGVTGGKVSVIPFGINNTVPDTELTPAGARQSLGIRDGEKTLLFFGNIASYKGLEYLITAFAQLHTGASWVAAVGPESPPSALRPPCSEYRLIIAGKPKGGEDYWRRIQQTILSSGVGGRIIQRIEYVPDEQTELYFKAADVLVLPYTEIFQSGVLFLGYSFGLPVIASDVGSLREEIVEGKTGFIFRPQDAAALANTIERYFASDLYRDLATRRADIRIYANERFSWGKVSAITTKVYSDLLA